MCADTGYMSAYILKQASTQLGVEMMNKLYGYVRNLSWPRQKGALGAGLLVVSSFLLLPSLAMAAPSVTWTSPPNNSVYNVGTNVAPTGLALGDESGEGLDLALVLDASGSMLSQESSGGVTQSRYAWQADAAIALVNSLPEASTAVAVIEFGSSASTVIELTPTTQASDILDAISDVPDSVGTGSTNTGAGIQQASDVLLGPSATSGHAKHMVVISDGGSNAGNDPVVEAGEAASNAITVHGVVIPGGNATEMENIASAGGGTFADFSDAADLQDLVDTFGAGGFFIGLDQLDIELPSGAIVFDHPVDAFGGFTLTPDWAIQLGDNQFVATATFDDGTVVSANLNLIGTAPVPATAPLMLLGLGLLVGGAATRNRSRA